MASNGIVVDRGNSAELDNEGAASRMTRWIAVARLGNLRVSSGGFSIWMQVRGTGTISAREGQFRLRSGDWIVLDRDSAPEVQSNRHSLTLGILLGMESAGLSQGLPLLPGRGHMLLRDLRIAMRLWHSGIAANALRDHGDTVIDTRALQSMLLQVTSLERDLDLSISRCPGRSKWRKRQVFARLQRARLFLEGNRHRVVRLTELAELTSFSSWYLSKTFHDIYDESPQAASVRLRLEHACELLIETDWSISEIGAACGFDSSCSFARAFRRRYGSTATAYRDGSFALTPRSAYPYDPQRKAIALSGT